MGIKFRRVKYILSKVFTSGILTIIACFLFHFSFAQSNCVTPPPGMVAWWDGDSISGSTAVDIQGTYDGTLVGATIDTGMVGNAMRFDGFGDYVSVGDPVVNTPPYTVDAWVNPTSIGSSSQYILANGGETTGGIGFALLIENGQWRFYIKDISGVGSYSFEPGSFAGANITSTGWTFLAGSWDGTTNPGSLKLYVDGVLAGTGTPISGATGNPQNLFIGSSTNTSAYLWDGLIDEVEVFDRELSQAEIQSIFDAGSAGKCKAPPPLPCDTLTFTKQSPTCKSGGDGAATVLTSGTALPYTYIWSTTDTTNSISNLIAGIYHVSVTNSFGCISTDSVILTEPPLIQKSVSTVICDMDSILLQGTFQIAPGIYYDTLTAINGCDSVLITTLNVNPSPTSGFTKSATELNVNFTQTSPDTSSVLAYAWDFGDGASSTLTNPSYSYISGGTYNVCLTTTNMITGCSDIHCDSVTVTVTVTVPGIFNGILNPSVNIYPNPSAGQFTLEIESQKEMVPSISVYNMQGEELRLKSNNTGLKNKLAFDLRNHANGIYVVRILTDDGVINKRITVAK
ncbi:MAG: hypothetical protein COB88_02075 [Flavobacteriales bacterium]|nr:MAG: hypothetical protein COB88_02075 [Flavobacteriales bacterium]